MAIAIAVCIFLFFDFIVVTFIIRAFTAPLRELAKEFPAQEPTPEAVRRNFQSFSFGVVNAGWSIHVAVDERQLHLSPAWIMRRFGVVPLSMPWNRVRLIKRGDRMTKVRVEGNREKLEVAGPTWCLELAS